VLRAAAAELGAAVGCDVHACAGRPATEIVGFASRPEVDLLVIASRGLSGVRRLLVGSTAEEVMRLAPVPVLVLPPAEETDRPAALPGTRLESAPV
jgi:nucleotide-binding universal stress UspA family protein